MAVKIEKKESSAKPVGFGIKDHIAVKLESTGKVCVVHKIQGQKLIDQKKATLVKDAKLVEGTRNIIVEEA